MRRCLSLHRPADSCLGNRSSRAVAAAQDADRRRRDRPGRAGIGAGQGRGPSSHARAARRPRRRRATAGSGHADRPAAAAAPGARDAAALPQRLGDIRHLVRPCRSDRPAGHGHHRGGLPQRCGRKTQRRHPGPPRRRDRRSAPPARPGLAVRGPSRDRTPARAAANGGTTAHAIAGSGAVGRPRRALPGRSRRLARPRPAAAGRRRARPQRPHPDRRARPHGRAAAVRPARGDAGAAGGNQADDGWDTTPASVAAAMPVPETPDGAVPEGSGASRRLVLPCGVPPDRCPVQALRDWLRASNTRFGPVFRKIDRWGNVEHHALGTDALRRIVARRTRRPPRTRTAPP
jgi:hypothetical protein